MSVFTTVVGVIVVLMLAATGTVFLLAATDPRGALQVWGDDLEQPRSWTRRIGYAVVFFLAFGAAVAVGRAAS